MSIIADNAKRILDDIRQVSLRAGRSEDAVSLVAATKMNSPERIQEAIGAGIKICGENRVQELTDKLSQDAFHGADVHFIGHLQRNKVKYVTGRCGLIQSVDSVTLMELISKRAVSMGTVQDILIEINVGGEESKSGIEPAKADELIAQAANYPGIAVKGLMCIPPYEDDRQILCNYFRLMRNLFIDIEAKKYDNVNMRILSMGMSGDYAQAIAEGATMVRVGSAIFGMRHYDK
ncbi:MAG: YggS family pyridoxal phosphate-dependent enzyme [Ruminococcaceae bacterium]|nr:YggS family pyridoxal phosphate-dependent enzyme [Oscillospiraceae bacterium]